MSTFLQAAMLLFILLNPFLLVVYMIDAFERLEPSTFRHVVFRAGMISSGVFSVAALLGDMLFRDVLQAQFASFQVFGGVIFLMIGLRFIFEGNSTVIKLRGEASHVAGAIAMPIMIGPGTIGASIVIGKRLDPPFAIGAVLIAVAASVLSIIVLKHLYDFVRERNERLVKRYIEVTGRVTALVIGTFAVEMIMRGLGTWASTIHLQ
jgi:small neutral amino acid transporter SnatA (MarC family)